MAIISQQLFVFKVHSRGLLTIGIQGIGISVVQRILSAKLSSGIIAVAQVLSTRLVDTGGVSELVKSGGGLVLGVALLSQGRKLRVVDVAVGDLVLRGQSVSQNVWLTIPVGVVAVVRGRATRGRAGFLGDSAQALGNGSASLLVGGLEVLLELGLVAGLGCFGRLVSQLGGVGKGSGQRGLGVTLAVGDLGATSELRQRLSDLGGLATVNIDGQVVGLVGNVAGYLAVHNNGNESVAADGNGTAGCQVAGRGDIKLILQSLTSTERGDSLLSDATAPQAALDTLELDLILCRNVNKSL